MAMPAEAYIALAAGIVTAGGVVITGIFKLASSRNGKSAVGSACSSHADVVRDMVSQSTFDVAHSAINGKIDSIDRHVDRIEINQKESFQRIHQRLDRILGEPTDG